MSRKPYLVHTAPFAMGTTQLFGYLS
jgi:hypothetical protein